MPSDHNPGTTRPSRAHEIPFDPQTPDDWNDPPPEDIGSALDEVRGAGGGDVTGPTKSTDNEVAVYDGTTGKKIKEPNAGHIEIGGAAATYDLRPLTDRYMNLGSSSKRFEDGHFAGEISGQRTSMVFGLSGTFSATSWLKTVDGITCAINGPGVALARPGHLVGAAIAYKLNARTSAGTITTRAYLYRYGVGNGNYPVLVTTIGITTGIYYYDLATWLRSAAVWVLNAGDVIGASVEFTSFVGTLENFTLKLDFSCDT